MKRKVIFTWFLLDLVDFTDEEGYGRYLDMHECYEKFINLKSVDVRIDFDIQESESLWM